MGPWIYQVIACHSVYPNLACYHAFRKLRALADGGVGYQLAAIPLRLHHRSCAHQGVRDVRGDGSHGSELYRLRARLHACQTRREDQGGHRARKLQLDKKCQPGRRIDAEGLEQVGHWVELFRALLAQVLSHDSPHGQEHPPRPTPDQAHDRHVPGIRPVARLSRGRLLGHVHRSNLLGVFLQGGRED